MKTAVVIACLVGAATASAQSRIHDHCPNAPTALEVTFPLDLPLEVVSGEATVGFTIGIDGVVVDATVTETSHPAFANSAVAAVKKLSCVPRSASERFSLPVAFVKPSNIPAGRCPNLSQVLGDSDIAFRYSGSRLSRGESAVVEFILQPSGQVTDLVVLRSSSQTYASEVSRLYQSLKCLESDEKLKVRASMGLILRR